MIKKLAICVPTYNRAALLHNCLLSIFEEIEPVKDFVEVIVSDNCSTDNTLEVIEEMKEKYLFKYIRNNTNIGANSNIVSITNYAEAEFCWIVGDDDFVLPGGVKRIVDIINTFPEIDYILAACVHFDTDKIKKDPSFRLLVNSSIELDGSNSSNRSFFVENWNDLINAKINDVFLGSLQLEIFRREKWEKYSKQIKIIGEPFFSLNNTYPHIVIFAHTMINCKAYYCGLPVIAAGDGARSWIGFVPLIYLTRLHDALDLYLKSGINEEQIRIARCYLLKKSGYFILKLLADNSLPRGDFCFFNFVKKYWKYKDFWFSFFSPIIKKYQRF